MKKIIALLTVALIGATAFYFYPESTEPQISSNQTTQTSKSLFLGKRPQLQLESADPSETKACLELASSLDDLNLEETVDFPEELLSTCKEGEFAVKLEEVRSSCFEKKSKHSCQLSLLFLRSLIRTKNHEGVATEHSLADEIVGEFSKKNPDFKKIEKISSRLMTMNPSFPIQKLWAMSKLLSQDDLKITDNLSDEIYSRVDPQLLEDSDMQDLDLLLKTKMDPSLIEQHLRSALESRPDNSRAHENLGWALWKQGKRQEAIEALETAVRLSPGDDWLSTMLREVKSPGSDENAYKGRLQLGFNFEDLFS